MVADLAAPYVLKAADAEEVAAIESAVARCRDCATVLEEHRQLVSLIGLAVPVAKPSDRARTALFARIESTPLPSLAVASSFSSTLTLPSSKAYLQPVPEGWGTKAGGSKRQRLQPRFRPNWGIIATPLATVPLVLALGIVGLWAMNTNAQLNDRTAQVQTLNQQVSQLSGQVTTLSSNLAQVDNFERADDATTYDIDGEGEASGQVIANPGTEQARLLVQGLGSQPATFEVLVELNSGAMVPAGKVTVNNEGKGTTVLDLSQPFASYRSVHVRPVQSDGSYGANDADLLASPDMLFAEIDPNVGRSDDTDALTVSLSASK